MYNELISLLEKEIQINTYNKELLPFWLDNLEKSKSFNDVRKDIILKVNELYLKQKKSKHTEYLALLGLISFLNKITNYDEYTLKSLYFLGFYLSDYDSVELESFVNAKISPKIINIISEKVDSLLEKSSYLDYYQGKTEEVLDDFTNMTNKEIKEKIGYVENASFDREDTHEIRRIWL